MPADLTRPTPPASSNRLVRMLDGWLLIGLVLVASLVQLFTSLPSGGHQNAQPYSAARCAQIFPRPHNPYDYALARDMARFRSACVRGAKLPR